jgi:hypothetical protein
MPRLLAEFDRELELAESASESIRGFRVAGTIRQLVERHRLGQQWADEWTKRSIAAARKASPLIDELTSPGKPSQAGKVTLPALGVSSSQAGRWRKLARLTDLGLERHYEKLQRSGHAVTITSALDLYERSYGSQHPNARRERRWARQIMTGPRCPTCGGPFPKRRPVTKREQADANRHGKGAAGIGVRRGG